MKQTRINLNLHSTAGTLINLSNKYLNIALSYKWAFTRLFYLFTGDASKWMVSFSLNWASCKWSDTFNNSHPSFSFSEMNLHLLKLLPKEYASICVGKTSLPSVAHVASWLSVLERKSKSLPARSLCKFLCITAPQNVKRGWCRGSRERNGNHLLTRDLWI